MSREMEVGTHGKDVKREHFVYSERALLARVPLKGVSDRKLN